ncbi:MAG: lipocalin-like domain-containing protein [Acidobacteria bacterium]|nr:lipocalin-like domain-containing protein [Acidobacteriota bacterium]MDA1235440.1 lipocalin-like domain-containing protein [Acidobacteriota bacterium]
MKAQQRIVLILLSLISFPGCQSSADNPLVGTWSLVSVSSTAADGTIDAAPYGESPTGHLTYTAGGYMQVVLAFSDRPRLSSDWRTAPAEQRAEAFATSLSYAGRFSIEDGQVTHHVEVSSDPNRIGTSITRSVVLKDGNLTLTTPPIQVGAAASEFALTWRRVGE